MAKKVGLYVPVNLRLRVYLKKLAAEEGVTMAYLLEKIIVEWDKSHSNTYFAE